MRAAVMRRGRIVADEFPDPEPGAGEVLVRTLACGICGSDLHLLQHTDAFVAASREAGGEFALDTARDLVMGHEFCAEILEHGPGAAGTLPVGTRVCSIPALVRPGGMVSVGFSNDCPGGYAERMVLSEGLLLPVPNGLATAHAALTEPMAVGWHAVAMARLTPEDVPLVIGCGPVGLAVIAALKLHGAGPIVAADFSPARRRLAEALGADVIIDPAEQSPYACWQDAARDSAQGRLTDVNPLTGERLLPPGVYFECVGVPGVLDQMMAGASRGCRVVVVGVCMEQDLVRPLLGITRELNLQFVLGYTPEEFAATLHHIAEGDLPVAPLITGQVGLEEVAGAFAALANPERHAKILVEPARA
ncbi:MAG: alcohol dehydrogenase [Gammaproteobacteria bacterium]|nr:alcohol dehydrogenase [Gammaproteobacteria bacterium]